MTTDNLPVVSTEAESLRRYLLDRARFAEGGAFDREVVARLAEIERTCRAAALREVAEKVRALGGVPFYSSRPNEYMCPNCVTPWKCNGPHIPEKRQSAGELIDRAALRSRAILTETTGASE